jgi:hypothetical protein
LALYAESGVGRSGGGEGWRTERRAEGIAEQTSCSVVRIACWVSLGIELEAAEVLEDTSDRNRVRSDVSVAMLGPIASRISPPSAASFPETSEIKLAKVDCVGFDKRSCDGSTTGPVSSQPGAWRIRKESAEMGTHEQCAALLVVLLDKQRLVVLGDAQLRNSRYRHCVVLDPPSVLVDVPHEALEARHWRDS